MDGVDCLAALRVMAAGLVISVNGGETSNRTDGATLDALPLMNTTLAQGQATMIATITQPGNIASPKRNRQRLSQQTRPP